MFEKGHLGCKNKNNYETRSQIIVSKVKTSIEINSQVDLYDKLNEGGREYNDEYDNEY